MSSNEDQICVIRVDGGICSQLAFVAYGIVESRPGVVVKYDLTWFWVDGRDAQGKQVRNWDVLKLMPDLKIDIATDEEIRFAKEGRKGYRYVSGYPDRTLATLKCATSFKAMMFPDLDASSQGLLDRICGEASCAIHVRRGDLANGDHSYGSPTPLKYYKRAIESERSRTDGKATFYVFTDDIEWCRENVMPLTGGGYLCENGADKGYVDLFLMTHCDAIISSIGSLGILAAVLSDKKPVLYLSHIKKLAKGVENVVYFDDVIRANFPQPFALANQYRRTGLYKWPYKIFRYLEKKLRLEKVD